MDRTRETPINDMCHRSFLAALRERTFRPLRPEVQARADWVKANPGVPIPAHFPVPADLGTPRKPRPMVIYKRLDRAV